MTTNQTDTLGVECPICHNEVFRLVTRKAWLVPNKISIKVKCCVRCAGIIDAEQESKNRQKYNTRVEQQEVSFRWANSLHGRKVIVSWQDGVHLVNFNTRPLYSRMSPKPVKQARGTAYRITNCSGGWGQVKVILDPAEFERKLKNSQLYGYELSLDSEDGYYYMLITYGGRKTIIFDESSEGDSTPP